MATATASTTTTDVGDQCVELRDIDWKGYTTLLRLRGEGGRPRMVYLDGRVLFMSPAYRHEGQSWRLGVFVSELVTGLDIPCKPTRSTTFRRRKKRGGVEPDESFYLANESLVRGKTKLSLRTDPPPDLVIEAVNTHGAEEAVEVYRRFGVPEVWVCDETELRVLVLGSNGKYVASETSASFPFLKATEIHSWIARPASESSSETQWTKDLRRWVREVVEPLHRAWVDGGSESRVDLS